MNRVLLQQYLAQDCFAHGRAMKDNKLWQFIDSDASY